MIMNLVKILTPDFKGSQKERIIAALPQIFDFDFPIWDERERKSLELKIISHYYIHEIGFETVELWKFKLEERLNLIMPYYNQRAKTYNIDYDYMSDFETTIDITSGSENSREGNSNTETNNHSTGNNLESDFPQANYKNIDYGTNLNENEFTENNETDNNYSESGKFNGKSLTESHGRNRPIAELIKLQRNAIINLESEIISELSDLFMQIYSY